MLHHELHFSVLVLSENVLRGLLFTRLILCLGLIQSLVAVTL